MARSMAMAGFSLGAVGLSTSALATSFTWDTSPGTVGAGNGTITSGNGTWNTTNGNWTADGGINNVSWPTTGTDNDAVFGAATTAVSIAVGGVTANDITFNNTAVLTISGGTLTLNGTTPTITINGSVPVINSVIDGTAGLSTAGTGRLNLGANNTFTGGVTIGTGSTLQITAGDTGSGVGDRIVNSNDVTINGTGILRLEATTIETIAGLNGAGQVVALGASQLTVGSGNANGAFSGAYVQNLVTTGASLTKIGTGTQTLSGANTYTGKTTVNAGTLQLAKTASLYNSTTGSWTAANITAASGATLALNVGGTGEFTAANVNTLLTNISVASTATTGLQAGAKLGFDTTNATGGTFTQGNAIADSTGASGGAIGLTKLGTGTLVLDKTNTYTGATTVTLGTLLVNGSTAAGSSMMVGANGTLGGTNGTIGGPTTVSGTLAPGSSIGALNFSSSLMLDGTSTYLFELAGGGSTADLADVTGTLSLSGGLLDLVQLGAYTVGDKFTLFAYDGTFSGAFSGIADDTQFTDAGGIWLMNYNDSSAGLNGGSGTSFVTVTAVPEPSTFAAVLGGFGILVGFQRGRRRSIN